MSIYCVYLTIYHGNKLPMFYIGKTTVSKIENGYRGSVSSQLYREIWKSEIKHNPQLFKTKIFKTFETRHESSIYEEYILRFFNAHKNPMYINMNIGGVSFNIDQMMEDKTHHFFSSEFQSKINKNRISRKTHQFTSSEFQKEMSRRAKSKDGYRENHSRLITKANRERVQEGTHNFLTDDHRHMVSKLCSDKNNRDNVIKLRDMAKQLNIKLGTNWYRKSDTWINTKIAELEDR